MRRRHRYNRQRMSTPVTALVLLLLAISFNHLGGGIQVQLGVESKPPPPPPPPPPQKQDTRSGNEEEERIGTTGMSGVSWRMRLGGPGSAPPSCRSKCKGCTPCTAVKVPIHPGVKVPLDYYPEAWRCKCRGKLYMP